MAVTTTTTSGALPSVRIQYVVVDDQGRPGRWDPCIPVHYRIYQGGAPPGGVDLIRQAVARAAAATSLTFVEDGPAAVAPQPGRDPSVDGIPLLIGWSRGDYYLGATSQVGLDRVDFTPAGPRITAAQILLNPEVTRRVDFTAGTRSSWGWGVVLLYRLGYVINVWSHDAPDEILSVANSARIPGDYGPHDRAALRSLGAGQPCF